MTRRLLPVLTGLVLLLTPLFTLAQSPATVSGQIIDDNQKPMHKVTVTLLRSKDSGLVKAEITDAAGKYEFINIKAGSYFVSASSVGFRKMASAVFTVDGVAVKMDPLAMRPMEKNLGEVVVTSNKPLIEQKIDRTVVNVEASPTNAGSTALEVLEKSPGVTVSNDGVISLKGKQGVMVMMDGKQTFLSQADLANMLRNMPASALEQIEIMTNPPAKYDAAGNAGIINIKTKKNRSEGYNGSITIGNSLGLYEKTDGNYAFPYRNNFSTNMNYRKGKVNVFGNYNFNYRKGMSDIELERNFYEKTGELSSYSKQYSHFDQQNNNHTLKLGVDYFVSKKDVFGVVVNGFAFFGKPFATGSQTITSADGTPETVLKSTTDNDLKFSNFSGNFNYKHTFDSTGREISVDLDYVKYLNDAHSLLTTDIYDGTGMNLESNLTLRNEQPGDINIYSAKTDYTHPLKKNAKFEAGLKTSIVRNDNEVVYERLENDKWIPDSRSNHFIYAENINAAYVNFSKKFKKFSFQAGLRLENTVSKGDQVTIDTSFRRNYTNLFPTGYLNYDLNKNNSLTLTYGRRIQRPNYNDLNPFTWFLDSLTFRQGNPYLLPQLSHNVELRHSFKNSFTTTFNYTITNDVISQLLKQDTEKKITYLTVDNVAKFTNIGIAINTPVKVAKWWNMNVFANVFNNHYEGVYYNSFTGNNDPIDLSYTSFMINVSNTFTFSKGWSAEISGWYRGKSVEQLSIAEPMYFMALGGQKNILKDKGTLRLNIRDPFHWQQYRASTRYSDIDVKIHSKWDNRNATLTFTYRFGKTTVAASRRRNSGTSEEQNRAGGGGQ